jgi:hypothetical protein
VAFLYPFWNKILLWPDVHGPLSNVVVEHALQFCNVYVFGKGVRIYIKRFGWLIVGISEKKGIIRFLNKKNICLQ